MSSKPPRKWRMEEPCVDCPFNKDGPGLELRKSLGRGRFKEITDGLKQEQHFICHKTSTEIGNGTNLICAGSINWQLARGITSNLFRCMENLDWIFKKRAQEANDKTSVG